MNRPRRPRRLLEDLHGREPSKTRQGGILAGRKQLVGGQMVVQVLALHRILDLDEILASDVALIVDGFAQKSQ